MVGIDTETQQLIIVTSQEDLKAIYDAVSDEGAGTDVVHITYQPTEIGYEQEAAIALPPLYTIAKDTKRQQVAFLILSVSISEANVTQSVTQFAISSEGVATVTTTTFEYPSN